LADWYDERLADFTLAASDVIERLLGSGSGSCLDLCCGTGLHLPGLMELGWDVTGLDISSDQLRRARERMGEKVALVHGDAAALPFRDRCFDAVVSMFTHTDVDAFSGLLVEVRRVLKPGSVFLYAGLHPCFVGPHSRFVSAEAMPVLYPGYRHARRYREGPGISPEGLRARVGAVHIPLGELVQAFLDASLTIRRFEEHGEEEYPRRIIMVAQR
jgi:ubiquinone/menaquinone biosynthesis C-methylase UbiE